MAKIQGKQVENVFDASIAGAAAIATSKLADGADLIKRTGAVAFTANQSMGGFKLTSVGDGTAANDAVNKAQLDAVTIGLSWKAAVRAATTANIVLSGAQTIDAVVLVAGNRVLVKNQTAPAENGLYLVAAGAWTRTTDMDAAVEFDGAAVFIQEGGQQSSAWTQTATVTTVGTDAVTFTQFDGSSIAAGSGLLRTGQVIDVVAGDGINGAFPGDAVAVKVSDFAGTNLEDDGANNLRIAATAAGAGLTGGGAAVLAVGAGDGISVAADSVAVSVAAIAGAGLEDDGANNLRIAATAAGAGLTLTAGVLAVGAGNGISVAADSVAVLPDGDSTVVTGSGLKAAVPTATNKAAAPTATVGDNATTGLTISNTPGGDGMVDVYVNGVMVELGQGVKTKDCYFSGDAGVTARAIAAIVATDTLYWNGVIAGFSLAATDKVDMNYNRIV